MIHAYVLSVDGKYISGIEQGGSAKPGWSSNSFHTRDLGRDEFTFGEPKEFVGARNLAGAISKAIDDFPDATEIKITRITK